MKSRIIISLLLICSFLITFKAIGQNKREILTNVKIIELVKLGLDDEIIVEKIRQSECLCDTSSEALAKLKVAKVSKIVIMAILESGQSQTANLDTKNPSIESKQNESSNASKSENPKTNVLSSKLLSQISEPGIYLFEDGKMNAIEPSVFSGSKMNPLLGTLTYGIKKTKYRAKVRGKSANMQVTSSQPEFYFIFNPEYKNSGATMAGGLWWGMPATSPAEFMLVQMDQKSASREAVLGEYGVWTGISLGARDKDIREYSFEKIKPGIYKVVPKAALTAGEYCFYYAGSVTGLGIAGGKVFDFSLSK
jgi:hypothetical protein